MSLLHARNLLTAACQSIRLHDQQPEGGPQRKLDTMVSTPDIRTIFAERLPDVEMWFEGDPGYEEQCATWNVRTAYHPLGVIQPTTVNQVQDAINCAREVGVTQLAIRGGGHSFTGAGLGGQDTRAVVIDMYKMRKVDIDTESMTAVVEGGAMLGELIQAAWDHGGLMVPTGDCPTVGVAGQAGAGGYGHTTRTFGILADSVTEMQVVTADGELRTANDTTNEDLFWALRGSGSGSYGVITALTLKVNKAPEHIAVYSLTWNLSDIDIAQHFAQVQEWASTTSSKVNIECAWWLGVFEVSGLILADSEAELKALAAEMHEKLPAQPNPDSFVKRMNYLEACIDHAHRQTSAPWYSSFHSIERERSEHPRYMTIKAGFVPDLLPDAFMTNLAEVISRQPRTGSRVQLYALNPELGLPVEATAIRNRGCVWLMGMSTWLEAKDHPDTTDLWLTGEKNDTWLSEAYEVFYPYTTGGYIGDGDPNEASQGRDLFRSYYGEHLPRLKAIKNTYDPGNLFHHPLSIPNS
ncbi:FAD-binding oxidoreductase [Amycolatopsis azurea]|uniref:FAD-binding oxidoreductase n=1 Tax=Amycolatopsis azurea TaxID=36819 RepID=UPI003803CE87